MLHSTHAHVLTRTHLDTHFRAPESAVLWPWKGISLTVGTLGFHVEQEEWDVALFCSDGGHTQPAGALKGCSDRAGVTGN